MQNLVVEVAITLSMSGQDVDRAWLSKHFRVWTARRFALPIVVTGTPFPQPRQVGSALVAYLTALIEMSVIAAMLLRDYSWELLPGQNVTFPMIPMPRSRSGIPVLFSSRRKTTR
jgi:hypothetical protein